MFKEWHVMYQRHGALELGVGRTGEPIEHPALAGPSGAAQDETSAARCHSAAACRVGAGSGGRERHCLSLCFCCHSAKDWWLSVWCCSAWAAPVLERPEHEPALVPFLDVVGALPEIACSGRRLGLEVGDGALGVRHSPVEDAGGPLLAAAAPATGVEPPASLSQS